MQSKLYLQPQCRQGDLTMIQQNIQCKQTCSPETNLKAIKGVGNATLQLLQKICDIIIPFPIPASGNWALFIELQYCLSLIHLELFLGVLKDLFCSFCQTTICTLYFKICFLVVCSASDGICNEIIETNCKRSLSLSSVHQPLQKYQRTDVSNSSHIVCLRAGLHNQLKKYTADTNFQQRPQNRNSLRKDVCLKSICFRRCDKPTFILER